MLASNFHLMNPRQKILEIATLLSKTAKVLEKSNGMETCGHLDSWQREMSLAADQLASALKELNVRQPRTLDRYYEVLRLINAGLYSEDSARRYLDM